MEPDKCKTLRADIKPHRINLIVFHLLSYKLNFSYISNLPATTRCLPDVLSSSRHNSFRFPKRVARPRLRPVAAAPAARLILPQALALIPRETGSIMELSATVLCRREGPGSVSPMTLHPRPLCGECHLTKRWKNRIRHPYRP